MTTFQRLVPRPGGRGRRTRSVRADQGVVSAEIALALPTLVIVVAVLITVVVAVAAQLGCVAAAREGARAAARGESATMVQQLAREAAPDGARVSVRSGDETVTVVVTATVRPLGIRIAEVRVRGEATALQEPDAEDTSAADLAGLLLMPLVAGPAQVARRVRRCGRQRRRRTRRHLRADSERGSGTVYAVAMIGVLAVVAGAATLVAKAHVAYQRAAAAADLGALAGARALVDGTAEPCAAAAQIVQRNQAVLAGCVIEGQTIVITSRVAVRLGSLGLKDATARARAGPVRQ